MAAASTESGFFVAPFGIDGQQAGVGFWATSKLSGVRLEVCREFLQTYGDVFDASWGGKLQEIRTKFTSTSSAAVATFYFRDRVASSLLLLSGHSPEFELSVIEMFVKSLNSVHLVQSAASSPLLSSAIALITERPLIVVVAWPEPTMSMQDHSVVMELGLHLAAVFLCKG